MIEVFTQIMNTISPHHFLDKVSVFIRQKTVNSLIQLRLLYSKLAQKQASHRSFDAIARTNKIPADGTHVLCDAARKGNIGNATSQAVLRSKSLQQILHERKVKAPGYGKNGEEGLIAAEVGSGDS